MTKSLFDSFVLGKNLSLKNRIVMAPMTRSRANEQGVPADISVEYYSQRASAGLIITEGTFNSENGKGYARTPGICSPEQVKAWKQITDAVHAKGGKIFMQVMHVGRVAHPLNKAADAETVAPSEIQAKGQIHTDQKGLQDLVMPRALKTEEISEVIEEYRQATQNAFEAGFDGVELHLGSGYLPMQFLLSHSNQRTDQYGGTLSNRIRFSVEVLEAMSSVKGSDRVGMRIWPGTTFNDMHDENPQETYTALMKAISPLHLAYVHVIRSPDKNLDAFKLVRDHFQGTIIVNGGFTEETGQAIVQSGLADLVSYGSSYIANPDLVKKFKEKLPLNTPDVTTFYTPGPKGYIDYL